MGLIAEDPWPLVWVCVVGAAVLLGALRLTGQGKYLIGALGLVGLAGLLVLVDRVWVTDRERVEETVEGLLEAVRRQDVEGVLGRVTEGVEVEEVGGERLVGGAAARVFLAAAVRGVRFDWLIPGKMRVVVAPISRQAKVELRIQAAGSYEGPLVRWNFATNPGEGSEWSLGLEETAPGVWKIHRITPLRLPGAGRLSMLRVGLAG
ncbi:MAG: hypothetical protein KatS3mg108_0237 [Isosphaeraceae bacterium]|jgi:hypothetical protein|nr:MAG: hypothetical protein KatS3mg108_0237 [Isosphaeraceae bacterium]